jgi:CRISPR/Cas system CMR-associated protein Cmr5 small subunit
MTVTRIDQGMAAAAVSALPDQVDRELRTRYRQLRVMLHSAGLAATYAFIASKAGDSGPLERAYRDAALGIRQRLVIAGLLAGDARRMGIRDVMSQLAAMDTVRYARASAEATAFAGWLGRLADAAWQERGDSA